MFQTNEGTADTAQMPIVMAFDERLRYSVEEASRLLRQSRALTYQQIRAGTLKSFCVGKRRYVHGAEIVRASAAVTA